MVPQHDQPCFVTATPLSTCVSWTYGKDFGKNGCFRYVQTLAIPLHANGSFPAPTAPWVQWIIQSEEAHLSNCCQTS